MSNTGFQSGGCSVINQTGCDVGNACVGTHPYLPGVCVPKNIPAFTGGLPLTTLPSCMQAAVKASRDNKQTPAHDAIMGRLGDSINDTLTMCDGEPVVPYCQQPAFYNTIYCACRNANLPYAECIAVDCTANYTTTAYLNTTQRDVRTGDRSKACPQQKICNSISNIGGTGNIAQISQTSNCDVPAQKKAEDTAKTNPMLAILLFVLVVLLAVFAAMPSKKKRGAPPMKLDSRFSSLPALPPMDQF